MASKINFIGSSVSPSLQTGVIMLNCLYNVDGGTVMVSLPNKTWADTRALFNKSEIDFKGEYPAIINKVVKYATKQFPHWSI